MRDTHAGDGQMQDSEHPRSIELDASSQKRKVVLLANLWKSQQARVAHAAAAWRASDQHARLLVSLPAGHIYFS